MKAAPVIHITGWPGSGKRTIAMHLRDRIGARLIDNHLILNPASALFERGTPDRSALRERLRAVMYEAALGLPADVPLILTDALAETDAKGPLIEPTIQLAKDRGAQLVPFVLRIDPEENMRRLTDPARDGTGKLTDAAMLRDLHATHRLLRLPGGLDLDVTDLSAGAAAEVIEAMIHCAQASDTNV
ncbi:hypothetical protein V8J82_00560 [Gymnodinialimonas sp. 2305UL16-5]|uniref:hypothetical protein n=1 Tax=Gymnodinialimonas mytili TaxID=3126503 RepID=UPI0030B7C014